ncbi:hypothetical protein ACFXTH_022687 [Malus domestica]
MIIFSPIFHTRLIRSFSSSSCRTSLPEPLPLQTLLKGGFTPTLKSIVQFLSRTRRFNTLLRFFSQMESNQIKGNSQAHSIVTYSAEIRRSRAFYEDPDDRSFEVAAESDVGLSHSRPVYQPERPREGFVGVAGFLGTHGIFPSSFTFCSLIHSFSNEGDMSKAIEVLDLMTDEKVKYPFDNFVSSSVISGFCKIGKPEIAVKFLENAVDSAALEPNIVTYAALVAALCKLGRVNEVCDLVCRIEKQGLAFCFV